MTEHFDILPCGYLTFRDDGIITGCNLALASWLGYSKEALAGKSIENILTLASRIFYNTHFFPLIRLHSKANEIFLLLKDKENRDIPVLANATRTVDQSEHIIHCVFMRVEERKKFEEELLQAKREAENALRQNQQLAALSRSLEQQALELDKQYQHQIMMNENLLQFGKIISHDLQEPIRKIQIFIDLIGNDTDTVLSTKSKKHASKIDVAAERLKTLTTSLQEYITVDHEKIYTEVDLNTILETAKARATHHRQFSDFDMETEKMPVMEGYEKQLELLFFHLVDNAIQFRDAERRLTIRVSHVMLDENIFRKPETRYKYTEHIRIIFEDNGIGFAEAYQDNIFLLFKKLDSAAAGLGIGLPLVKKIAHNHSGTIRVTSEPGSGTRFEIELPVKVNG